MAWRGLHISRDGRLNFGDGQFIVRQGEDEVRVPIEDIAWIVIDAPHVTISSTLMSACMVAGISIVFSDETHTPCGIALPFHRHFRQGEITRLQVGLSQSLKAKLWRSIVRAKIRNQARVLALCGSRRSRALDSAVARVSPGDPDNVEARAARVYFLELFADFARSDNTDVRNAMLNYGYAIVRSGIARALTAYGLIPSLGLKHASQTNAFNLADDLVEPFRPFVDLEAVALARDLGPKAKELTLAHRRHLAGILLRTAIVGTENVTLLTATEKAAESLIHAIEERDPSRLALPQFPPSASDRPPTA